MSPHLSIAMTRPSRFLHRAGLAVLLGLGVAAVADAQPAARLGVDARLDRLTDALDLSADQSSQIDALGERYADADRAGLWAAAADVASILTDAQLDQLQQAASRHGDRRPARGERGRRPRGEQARRPHGERRARPDGARRQRGGDRAELSDAQREALRAIHEETREQTEALVTQLREGALSEDEFVEQTRALREDAMRRSADVLPDEAAERMAAHRAQRDAETAARERALGLTDAQKARLQSERLDRVREGRPDVRPYLDEDGRLDREAMRDAMRERHEAARAAREADPVLTAEQQAVVFLHGALAGRGHGPDSGRMRRGGRTGR